MRMYTSRLLRLFIVAIFIVTVLYMISYTSVPGTQTGQDIKPIYRSGQEAKKMPTLIDWEDYKFVASEKLRKGPGEHGLGVRLSPSQQKEADKLITLNGFNIYVSDMIALDRSLRDIRHPKCIGQLYSSVLPTASIIIPLYEEHWNTLLRTVVSSLNRAPAHLIKEVILVDDGSTREHLKDKLDQYLKTTYPDGKVRAIHLPTRQGLITARLAGAKEATGEVLIFLDSHCEASTNWLPPLLDPIAKDYRTVVCPFIDVLDADTFEYRAQDEGARGAFDWEFFYKRLPRLPEDSQHPEKPFDSPIMAGGLFAISRKWFWELGGYDPGLAIWGGEQYELSFKIWMCGGRMIDTPCSRIGHVYRTHPTSFPNPGIGDFVGRNYKRVAEVWMDEYKEYIYKRRPHYRRIDAGDLTAQHDIRKRLNCKSFKWFMTEVAFDLTKKYPPVDPIASAVGEIRSVADSTMCVDALDADEKNAVKLKKCIKDQSDLNGIQRFEFTYADDIRPVKSSNCFDVPNSSPRSPIIFFPCHGQHGNQFWQIKSVNNDNNNPVIIRHASTDTCMESDPEGGLVYVNHCRSHSLKQQWTWEKLQIVEALESRKRAGIV